MDSIALAVTALLGIVSYLVQAKISRDAERSQKDSDRVHADNARAEGKAEKLLARVQVRCASTAPFMTFYICRAYFVTCSRVQTQMECFVAPLTASNAQLSEALHNTMGELGLSAQIEHWQLAWLKVSAAPHIEDFHFGNPLGVAALLKSPYFKLNPEDIGVLEGDPAVRQRYTELVVETWLPPLRVMVDLFITQVRLKSCAMSWHAPLVIACDKNHMRPADAPQRRYFKISNGWRR
jgi:hypothetical protein